jgi:hypothetical protein
MSTSHRGSAGKQDREPADYRRDYPGDVYEEDDGLRDDEDKAKADRPAVPVLFDEGNIGLDG